MRKIKNIVLNIPHSSKFIPVNTWSEDISKEIEHWTDKYTDLIFVTSGLELRPVIFPYSRFFCDAERLENDPLEAVGQGIAYTSFNGKHRYLNNSLSDSIHQLWYAHQLMLKAVIDEDSLLIDCHSFPAEQAPEIDICIGFNEDASRPSDKLIELVKSHFEENGFRVGLNTPYSNSMVLLIDHEFEIPSIMIEINKKIYLDENGNAKNIEDIQSVIAGLYEKILASLCL